MRFCRSSRTSASNERTVRPIVTSLAITFIALPPWIVPTVTTAVCVGSTLRATTVCSAITMLAAATIGSIVWCGRAAWPPTAFHGDRHAVGRRHERPAAEVERAAPGLPGWLCMPKIASHGKRSNRPSASMRFAPQSMPASSAGWKMRLHRAGEIARRREMLRRAEQHRRVAVVAARVHDAFVPARVRQAGLLPVIGSASMSARRPMLRVPLPALSVPTTPVPPTLRVTS